MKQREEKPLYLKPPDSSPPDALDHQEKKKAEVVEEEGAAKFGNTRVRKNGGDFTELLEGGRGE